ncbi:MAG TPA: thioredoxin domain-containing protein [Polyangiaceae bacterium]
MNKGTAILGFFLCFIAGMGLMYGIDKSKGTGISAESGMAAGSLDHSASPVPVTGKDPQWGNADAPVTIVEISDFECPFCSRVNPTMKQIKETYGRDKVRIVWKHNPLPFHKAARGAHEAAATVMAIGGSDAFWKFHDLAFANQQSLNDANYEKWATESGVEAAKFKEAYSAKKYASKVDEDLATSQKIGANGTPNFRVNGVEVSGAQPFDKFKEVIDAQLAEAKKLVAAGTKPADVYVELTKKNAKAAPAEAANKPAAEPEEDKSVWKVAVLPDDPVKGPPDALVTIVEFSEFECPFCKRVQDTQKQISQTYPNDVRFVWKDNPLPFHQRANPAAALARTAYKEKGNKGFWEAHDMLFENQTALQDTDLQGYAQKLGLNWNTVKTNIDSKKFDEKFTQSQDLASDVNARGTPHFFVNGRRITGAQPFDNFKKVIDEELAKAKALVAQGTPKARIYDEIMKQGKEPPPPEKKNVAPPPADSPYKGGANAKVVIQEWSDFECPFCKRVEPTVTELEKEYGQKIKIVWRHLPLPFHKAAQPAAEATHEAFVQKGNDAFWKFHAALFEVQGTPGGLERASLEKIAQSIGLDMAKFKNALDTGKHKARVQADADAAQKADISGTPAFVVNGYFISGAQPAGAFKRVIARAMKEAQGGGAAAAVRAPAAP